ncbi:PREDICTED: mitotic-spindle organizing protein 1A-like [Nelumbo nucifera]|uniref:Mitotic-spindle organizing protein 1A-like n=1 Tax=Nelumbo nucifera TaxID=4432 RepID=A0A1U8B5Q3_NELNU|nr:PREDICTED: mitotic-spindle organizing protein 1A-like [Nelumbo nucifera]
MDLEAAQRAQESVDLAFHMSNILDTGFDRYTLSILINLCDLGLNPEALAAVVKDLQRELSSSSTGLVPIKGVIPAMENWRFHTRMKYA